MVTKVRLVYLTSEDGEGRRNKVADGLSCMRFI